MDLMDFRKMMMPAVEQELKKSLEYIPQKYPDLSEMLAYHMGWSGDGAGVEAQGKRIRPLMVTLCTAAAGGDWEKALPAASAVELVHNFSLIHDDIQDQSELRRGRKTVWVKWGVPQAINAGDLMFTLAHLAMFHLAEYLAAEETLAAVELLDKTAVKLTVGQYLDMAFEKKNILPLDDYYPMIGGKTASLLSCCTELGALVAGGSLEKREQFARFGYTLGLAFQVQDDWLGIWGDEKKTGKSTEGDLVTGKKTLPILYALENDREFNARWSAGPIHPDDVPTLKKMLINDGTQDYTQTVSDQLMQDALLALDTTSLPNEASAALKELTMTLLNRQK